ncbi:hypothetical protein RHGRI_000523 [Rhododendron griersonianum]|uniref:ENTH domain-containing protein n=1 Tax=Rhododendron griersonianum TaxID=479676 RepID=A0AAV6LHA3_9ERIC|nr:hypothetical protein RHGRI_000523 [Rhododendron griersonianum]
MSTQKKLRKTLGAIKDSTTVNLAKVNSEYKELDVAIVRATNHVERPAKEKHIRAIFAAISATRPRADVAYCIHALARRLSKTHNWAVALKTLIVIHRALREVDPTFQEELIHYGRRRTHMLNLAHFKDDSSPNAWDYSAWVRTYALFLEERLECFRVLKYDVESDRSKSKDLDTPELLKHLPALQELLFRVLGCQPQGAAVHNFVIQLALSMVASESIKICNAISDAAVNLVDKFFEMQRPDALKALDMYRRGEKLAERLSEFYEVCKSLDIGRGKKFVSIEQVCTVIIYTNNGGVCERSTTRFNISKGSGMGILFGELIMLVGTGLIGLFQLLPLDAIRKSRLYPSVHVVPDAQGTDDKNASPKIILALEYKKSPEVQEETHSPSPPEPEPEPEPAKVEAPVAEPPDLLGLNDPTPAASDLYEKNALALAIVPVSDQSAPAGPNLANGTTGWELALVTAPSSNESATADSKLGGGLDKLTLDSLYDDAIRRSNQNVSYNPWEPAPITSPTMPQMVHDPFFASNTMAAPPSVQMAAMANQHQAFMFQQQQQQPQMMTMTMMGPQQQHHVNPFGNAYGAGIHPYGVQAHNTYAGLI